MVKKIIIPVLLGLSACLSEEGKELGNSDTFTRLINGGYDDVAQDVKQTDDGGFIVLGTTEVENQENLVSRYKIKLIKMDKYGHIQWKKNYPAYDSPQDSISYKGRFVMLNGKSTEDKGYLIVGDSIQVGGQPHIRVMITDGNGNIKKATNIGHPQYTGLEGVAAAMNDNGNYVVLGAIKDPQSNEDMFLTELDANLETVWEQTYGAGTTTLINKLFNDDLSTALFWAGSVSKSGMSNIRFIKAPPDSKSPEFDLPIGQLEVDQTGNDFCRYGFGFAFVGSSKRQGNEDIFVKGISQDGGELFSNTYGDPNQAEGGLAITAARDGGLVLLGFTENAEISRGGKDFYLMKIDPFGKKKWSRTIGSRNNDIGVRVINTSDGGFLILGTTSFGGLSTMSMVKTDEYGNIN